MQKSYKKILRQLQYLRNNLQKTQLSKERPIQKSIQLRMRLFRRLLLDNNGMRISFIKLLPKKDVLFFRKYYARYETNMEYNQALTVINGVCDIEECISKNGILSSTFNYAFMEGKMAKITKKDHILIIGSGPFPETAICYAKLFGCTVTCIEKKLAYVKISRLLLSKAGFDDLIHVVHAKGEDVKNRNFTKILITALTSPKRDVLINFNDFSHDIIIRTTYGTAQLAYTPLDEKYLNNFKIKKILSIPKKNFTSSILAKRIKS